MVPAGALDAISKLAAASAMPHATIQGDLQAPSAADGAAGADTISRSLSLYYDRFEPAGSTSAEHPLVLLIMGLGAQCVQWDADLCQALADRGYLVVRFDNRDIGLSTRLEDLPVPRVLELLSKVTQGQAVHVDYCLTDLAADAARLITALGYERAHVVGASMGGMIAQRMALHFSGQVRSLTSIMSTTGAPDLPRGTPQAFAALTSPPPTTLEEFEEYSLKLWRVIGSPKLSDGARTRRAARLVFERGTYPHGFLRQFAAVIAEGSRREALAQLKLPTLVIHGSADPLIPVECGRDTARAIPGADLLELADMGHDLPECYWPQMLDAMCRVFQG